MTMAFPLLGGLGGPDGTDGARHSKSKSDNNSAKNANAKPAHADVLDFLNDSGIILRANK
jgi:hypothetical protein